MKAVATCLFIFFSYLAIAQELEFKGEVVDSIRISSHLSSYQFDDKGTTKGVANVVLMIFDEVQNSYVIGRFFEDKYERTIEPDTVHIDRKHFTAKEGSQIDRERIEFLLMALTDSPVQGDFLAGLDTTALKCELTKRRVRKIAKDCKVSREFRPWYSTAAWRKEIFDTCLSMDSLRVYGKERFSQGQVTMSDYSNEIEILISTAQKEYRFGGKYPNPIKQPWIDHSQSSGLRTKSSLNLNINKALIDLLPDGFLLKESISLNALARDYVHWVFERRSLVY